MLLTTLALAALIQPAPAAPPSPVPSAAVEDSHGKLPWFNGTFDELVAKAKAENKIVFIDFWTSWCGWCKKLDKDTYSSDAVVQEMKDILVYNIDAESKDGAPVAERYGVHSYPTLVLLNADATVRDVISGYKPPEPFIQEIQRIRRDEGTLNALRRDAEANKSNLDKRWTLAQKLKSVGDTKGYDAQVAEIKKLDPKGESVASRSIAFDDVLTKVNALWKEKKGAESPKLIEDFLATEKNGEMLFKGYSILGQIHGGLAQQAGDDSAPHEAAMLAAWKKAWPYTPSAQLMGFGNQLAWTLFEKRDTVSPQDKAFALEVAKKIEPLATKDAQVLDTVACVYSMNGDKAKALELAKRCVELEPSNKDFQKRVTEFGG